MVVHKLEGTTVELRYGGEPSCMPWTYMLRCSDGSYHVGSTWDLERRVNQHNGDEGAAYTRRRRPVELVWWPSSNASTRHSSGRSGFRVGRGPSVKR